MNSMNLFAVVGRRDRSLIALTVYSFARVGAAVAMRVEDHFIQGRRGGVRLHEKGGQGHEVPGASKQPREEFLFGDEAGQTLSQRTRIGDGEGGGRAAERSYPRGWPFTGRARGRSTPG
jgi:hypothetical protein